MGIESSPQLAPALADKLGRFEIITRLGRGGMAEVFLAVQRAAFASNKLVVIKKLKRDANDEHQMFEMFVDEARIAMRLTHPNVVNTFDFVAEGDEFYLTMEFLDGQSLLQTMRKVGRDKLPLELHIWILIQVLAGLGYAHGLRDFDGTPLAIVHRDVTPSNVILTYAGGVKLVDFGIAKVAGAMAITQNGTMKGKLGYASPEQCLGKPTTARSDLYSVGVMLWEAMAGRRRTIGETPAAIYQARIAGTERRIEDVWLDAPASLVKIVKRALAPAPDRYATASEFQRDLEDYLKGAAPGAFGTLALADFMSAHFASEMETLHRTIEARVAGASRAFTPAPLRSVSMADRREGPSPTPTGSVSIAAPESGPTAPGTSTNRPARRRSRPAILGLLGLLGFTGTVVLAAVIFFAVRGGGWMSQPPTIATAGADAAVAPPPAKTVVTALVPSAPALEKPALAAGAASQPITEPAAVPPAATATSLTELRVVVRPRIADTRISLDGHPLTGNPVVISRPKDDVEHVLTVTAEGYEPIERVVTLGRDVRIGLKLTRKSSRTSDAAAGQAAPRPRLAARAGGETPAVASGGRAGGREVTEPDESPGADLHRSSFRGHEHEPRHIDEKDPYTP